ncbi:hypothetical protein SETIT_9G079000v2 [Setaria italica]|uniref:Uncharacterized protein n=1 Tax=Setaria italica TaxID=4555 RepID=A0A368SEE5_SETIT|nr:hypothetical protein SETIT_9G079000v2 [Setaria italica]
MGILEAVAWKSKNPSTIFSKKCLCTVGVEVQRKGYAKDPSLVVHIILRSSPLMVSARVFMSKIHIFMLEQVSYVKDPSVVVLLLFM